MQEASVRKKSVAALGFLGKLVAVLEQQTQEQDKLGKQDKKLNEVLDEILATEATYLDDLTFTVCRKLVWRSGGVRSRALARAGGRAIHPAQGDAGRPHALHSFLQPGAAARAPSQARRRPERGTRRGLQHAAAEQHS